MAGLFGKSIRSLLQVLLGEGLSIDLSHPIRNQRRGSLNIFKRTGTLYEPSDPHNGSDLMGCNPIGTVRSDPAAQINPSKGVRWCSNLGRTTQDQWPPILLLPRYARRLPQAATTAPARRRPLPDTGELADLAQSFILLGSTRRGRTGEWYGWVLTEHQAVVDSDHDPKRLRDGDMSTTSNSRAQDLDSPQERRRPHSLRPSEPPLVNRRGQGCARPEVPRTAEIRDPLHITHQGN
jgi:hypothetical protein